MRRGRLIAVAAVLLVGAGIAAVVVVPRWLAGSPRPSPLVAELDRVRDDTGLFFRPGLLAAGQPSVVESAYGMGILRAAGRPVAVPAAQALSGRVGEAVAKSSVWGAWYVAQIDADTGAPVPGDWYRGVIDSLRPEGYFRDSSQSADDRAADLAATAAGLDVLRARHVALAPGQVDAVARWVGDALDRAENPYQACNAVRALHAVDRLDQPTRGRVIGQWLGTPERLPARLDSFESVLDTYGIACLTSELSAGDRAAARVLLVPALSHPVDDLQLLYYVADAWRLIGGQPDALGTLAAAATARLDKATGLMVNVVKPIGTLENSYYVTEIRRLAGVPEADRRLADGTRQALSQHGEQYSLVSILLTAVVLRAAGDRDQDLEQRAVARARQQLTAPVTRDSVSGWAMAHTLLGDLGVTGPEAPVTVWPITTREDRGLAWVLLGQLQHVRGHEPPPGFAALVPAIPGILATQAGLLSTVELRAGVAALAAADQLGSIPTAALARELAGRRGCPDLPDLYRPSAAPGDCDLRATADSIWMRTFLHTDKGGTP